MKQRVLLLLAVLGLLVVIVVLLGAGEAIASSRTQQLALQRANAVDQIAQRAQAAITLGDPTSLEQYLGEFHAAFGESVMIVDSAGGTLASVGGLTMAEEVQDVALAASRAVPQWSLPTAYPWSEDTALVAKPLISDNGSVSGVVVLEVDQTTAIRDVTNDWLFVGAVGLALLALLLAGSLGWTRWVLRPVSALDAAALALAEHRKLDLGDASGPPELRQLAASFRHMAGRVEAALEQQHGLVADASHQLRTPLAAIRLRMDALAHDLAKTGSADASDPSRTRLADDIADDIAAIDTDLDRLERTVERMLELANAEHRAGETQSGRAPESGSDAPTLTAASAPSLAEPHRSSLAAAGINLIAQGEPIRVACRASDLDEMVEILLDNARKYAGAGATVWVTLERREDAVALEVADSGPGLDDAQLAQIGTRFWRAGSHAALPGTGLGHAILNQLALANHATVTVDRAPQGGLRTRIRMRAA